jgi:hypothetical protein
MQEDRSFYVYGYIREDYGTYFYIGKGCKNRAFSNVSRSDHFMNIKNKTDYEVVIIEDNLTEHEAYELERDLITHMVYNEGYSIEIPGFKREQKRNLVNHSFGGSGPIGKRDTDETRKKKSEVRLGIHLSEETKQKLSDLNAGKNHPNYGKHLSEETKQKISEANKNRQRTPEWRENLSKSHIGQVSHQRKRVHCIELDLYFDSIEHAMCEMKNTYNIKCGNVGQVCAGKRPTAGKLPDGTKLHWEWAI